MHSVVTRVTLILTLFPFTSSGQLQKETSNAPQALPSDSSGTRQITVPVGENFRVTIEKGFRLTGPGEPVVARLTQPVYVGQDAVVGSGAIVSGHVSSVAGMGGTVRLGRLLEGDFTPQRLAKVTFDQITLPDGTTLPISSEATAGYPEMKESMYRDKRDRAPLKARLAEQVHGVTRATNKLQRLTEAASRKLPYHPEYIDQGTVYDATLLQSLTISCAERSIRSASVTQTPGLLHLRLVTPLSSSSAVVGEDIDAVVTEPYYDSADQLIYPAGLRLTGNVLGIATARRFQKQGSLMLTFRSIDLADGSTRPVKGVVQGVEAPRTEALLVTSEGQVKATTSRVKQVWALIPVIGPSYRLTDLSQEKTVWTRQGDGRKGFGLVGAAAAQASAGAAVGFAYFGAARGLFAAFLAKGRDVVLPANTPLLLRLQN
jgi:hypothetical protein